MLGLPIVAFVAAGAAVGLNPSFYSGAIGFVIGVCFVGAAIFEVHRLATTRSEDLFHGWIAKRKTRTTVSVEMASRNEVDRTRVEVRREPHDLWAEA